MLQDLGYIHAYYWLGEILGALLCGTILERFKMREKTAMIATQFMCLLSCISFIGGC